MLLLTIYIIKRIDSCYNATMKRSLVDILACPVCKGELELKVEEERKGEVIKGSLRCAKCKVDYPITDSIPNLLPQTAKA